MAMLYIGDYIDFATKGYHNASSWQVALDPEFTKIIDESLEDKINVESWNTPLPKIGADGYYKNMDQLFARVKVHIFNSVSPWFVIHEPINQNEQEVEYTYPDGTVKHYDSSLAIGLN